MKTTLSLTLLLLLSSLLSAQVSWTNHVNDQFVWDIEAQDEYFIAATRGGVVRVQLDSGQKEIFQPANSGLQGSAVLEVEMGHNETVWVGSEYAGLFQWDGADKWINYHFINTGDTLIELRQLKVDPNGNPWFLSYVNGSCWGCPKLISFDGERFTNHQANLQLEASRGVGDFTFINDTELWVIAGRNIVRYDGENILASFNPTQIGALSNEWFHRLEVDNNGHLWLSTSRSVNQINVYRLLRYDGTNWTVMDDNAPGYAYKSFKDANGTLWFHLGNSNTRESTIASYDGTNWEYWPVAGLSVPYLYTEPILLDVDAAGNWWMDTYTGPLDPHVYQVTGDQAQAYDTQITPLGNNYHEDVVADCENNIWIPAGSTLNRFDGENWAVFLSEETGFPNTVWDATVDPISCDIWFALYSNEDGQADVGRYDGTSFHTYDLGVRGTRSITVAPDGTVYAGSSTRGIARFADGNWTFIDEDSVPIDNHVTGLFADSGGALWVSSYNHGVTRFAGAEVAVFDNSNSPVPNHCYWFFEDSQGNIWMNGSSGDLVKYDGTNWEVFTLDENIGWVLGMAEDGAGNFWLAGSFGAAYWNGFSFDIYNIHNAGMGGSLTWNVLIDSLTSDIWFQHNVGTSVLSGFQAPNHISGIVFFDANQDGAYDPDSDVRLPDQQVQLLPEETTAITNTIGGFSFYPATSGTYELHYSPTAPFEPVSPTSLTVDFNNAPVLNQNFAVWAEEAPEGISVDLVNGPVVCNEEFTLWLTFRNEGFLPISGELELAIPGPFTPLEAYPAWSSINADSTLLTWSFTDLPYMQSRTYRLTLLAPGVDELDQVFEFLATMTSGEQSESAAVEVLLLCSYDPNDKLASAVGPSIDQYSLLGEPLQYTIRFQNMGNYRAKDVLITDIIGPALDISTLQVLSSSHEMTTTIKTDREVTFRFDEIYLPPEEEDFLLSQGYVKYQISPLPNLPDPTLIENTANIYFDLNPAIVTNTTQNVLVETLEVNTDEIGDAAMRAAVYPNPTQSGIWIHWQNEGLAGPWEVAVYDLTGRLILQHQGHTIREQVVLPEQGMYLLKVRRGAYRQTTKVVVVR